MANTRQIEKIFLILGLLILGINNCCAQLPSTFWLFDNRIGMDFRIEPPQLDTSLKNDNIFAQEVLYPLITNKRGMHLGYFSKDEHTEFDRPNTMSVEIDFNDLKHTSTNVGYLHNWITGAGILSFDDTTHYFFKGGNNGHSQLNRAVYQYNFDTWAGLFWSSSFYISTGIYSASLLVNDYRFRNDLSRIHFLPNNSIVINNSKKIKTSNNGSQLLDIGTKRITFDDAFCVFVKKSNKVYEIIPATTYLPKYTAGTLADQGLLIAEVDRNLQIVSGNYQSLVIDTISDAVQINPLEISKSKHILVVEHLKRPVYYKYVDKLELIYVDDSFRIINTKLVSNASYIGCNGSAFSPNDSFFFIMKLNGTKYILSQVNTFTAEFKDIRIIGNNGPFSNAPILNIGTNGKIYIFNAIIDSMRGYQTLVIDQPNRAYPDCKIQTLNNQNYQLLNLHPSINKTAMDPFYVYAEPLNWNCTSGYFKNTSDTNFITFTWYWGDGDSTVTTRNQKIVYHKYPKTCKYFLRIKGAIPEGYWSWYSDSIPFYKPDFLTKDSMGCQWIEQTFYDSSYSTDYFNGPTKWVWNFGDGETTSSDKPYVKHVFKKSGMYTVNMKIYNGYCIDSVVKISVINILPAAKPGFTVDKNIVCLPDVITVTDTLTQLVLKKTYRFADSLAHENLDINKHNISFTYVLQGHYNIVQTLYSISGCISKDSIYVEACKSVKNLNPTQPIVNVNNENQIEISWLKNHDVPVYNLLRSENYGSISNLKSLTDTFTIDSGARNIFTTTYQYTLQYRDQCSNFSNNSKFETSILLKGINHNNSYSTLNWNTNNITKPANYNIQKVNQFDTSWINVSYNNLTDYSFYSDSSLKICYKVFTMHSSGYRISSNSICIGYEPFVLIPTLYDVNEFTEGLPVRGFYLKDFSIEIFDIIGRKIFSGNNISRWHGDGIYTGHFFLQDQRNQQRR